MLCEPRLSAAVVRLALLPVTAIVPKGAPPLRKLTLPVAAPPNAGEMVAVKVTG
jgi:hypothetical protein